MEFGVICPRCKKVVSLWEIAIHLKDCNGKEEEKEKVEATSKQQDAQLR